MSDKFLFLLAEGLKNLWRHKLTTLVAILSTFLALVVVGGLIIGSQNTDKLIHYFRSKYKIEVFFQSSLSDLEAQALVESIGSFSGVRSTTLISKEDAVEIFNSQFGEDILGLVGYNPLPASCVVNVERSPTGLLQVEPIIQQIHALKGVDEIRYQGPLIQRIERYYQYFLKGITVFTVIVVLIAVMIISNTVRLSIYVRKDLIEAFSLIGATRAFVRTPFLIESILQSLIGALLASAVLTGLVMGINRILDRFINFQIHSETLTLTGWLVGIAVLISLLGSSRSINRLLK